MIFQVDMGKHLGYTLHIGYLKHIDTSTLDKWVEEWLKGKCRVIPAFITLDDLCMEW